MRVSEKKFSFFSAARFDPLGCRFYAAFWVGMIREVSFAGEAPRIEVQGQKRGILRGRRKTRPPLPLLGETASGVYRRAPRRVPGILTRYCYTGNLPA